MIRTLLDLRSAPRLRPHGAFFRAFQLQTPAGPHGVLKGSARQEKNKRPKRHSCQKKKESDSDGEEEVGSICREQQLSVQVCVGGCRGALDVAADIFYRRKCSSLPFY